MIWDLFFNGIFQKKNGVLLRRTVCGDSLAHFSLFSAGYPWQGRHYWNARHDPGVLNLHVTSHSRHRDGGDIGPMYNEWGAPIYIIISKGYTSLGTRKQKRMGFIFFSASKRDFRFCFVLHIDLASGLLSRFWEDFIQFSFLVRPFAGSVPIQAQAKCVGQRFLLGGNALSFFSFLFQCTMSLGAKKIFEGLGRVGYTWSELKMLRRIPLLQLAR